MRSAPPHTSAPPLLWHHQGSAARQPACAAPGQRALPHLPPATRPPRQVRARVDARFALDPTSVPASEGERSTLKGVLQTALSVRPSLLEAVYGLDCVLPGTEGAVRLALWVSPKRREAMAELRLF